MAFQKLLEKYRKISFSKRDKGDRFERLMQAYLQTDPTYANKFRAVWLWNEFPSKMDFGGQDVGIDIVAQTVDGDYWAMTCLFILRLSQNQKDLEKQEKEKKRKKLNK